MLEDIVFQIGVICLGLLGTYQFIRAVYKFRVFCCAPIWPKADAKLRHSRVSFNVTETFRTTPSEQLDQIYFHSVQDGFLFTKLTTRWYYPLLRFSYDHHGKTIETDNLAAYNRKAFYFSNEDVKKIVEQYERRNIFQIRYNPSRPGEVFLGTQHFPYFCTMLQAIAAWFFALSFSITAESGFGLLGLAEPRIGDRPISIFVITTLLFSYGLLRITVGLLQGNKHN